MPETASPNSNTNRDGTRASVSNTLCCRSLENTVQRSLLLNCHTFRESSFERKKSLLAPQTETLRGPILGQVQQQGVAMSALNDSSYDTDSVIHFAPNARNVSDNTDQLDRAGQTILQLLHKAAGAAEDNSRHALEMAQKISDQLRAAEDRVSQLEAELETYRDRAERAEQWLHRVYSEIEDRFLRQSKLNGAPQRSRNARGH
jgi:chromosome segregation ATPase